MLRRCRVLAAAGTAFALVPLAACAIVDKYSDRAVEYNLQAEKTQQQNLLLNIIRASLRRPMQFTGLSSITGTASASGSVTGGYTNAHQTPYISLFHINPANTSTIISRTVTGTGGGTAAMSGGPTFTVPVLDTQEFYQGILSTLTPQIVDYYVQQGFPPHVLFDLFVSSIDVTAIDPPHCTQYTFVNSVRNRLQLGQFEAFADYLIGSGFTTERVADVTLYGPPVPRPTGSVSAADTAKIVEAYSKASSAGLDIRVNDGEFQLQKKNNHYRFCFAYKGREEPTWLGLDRSYYCGHFSSRRRNAPQQAAPGNRCVSSQSVGTDEASFGINLSSALLDRIDALQRQYPAGADLFPTNQFRNVKVNFKLHTRSVEGILYYLGEITRQYLSPEFEPSRITQVKTGVRYGTIPIANCEFGGKRTIPNVVAISNKSLVSGSYTCENLFVLEKGAGGNSYYSVIYDGETYSIPRDPDQHGRSLQVLELVKQLLALHTSAKQLPQSSVISIVGSTAQ